MRASKIPVWVCGAILCCAMPAGFCQALSGSLAEGTGPSTDSLQGVNGTGAVKAEVSADANLMIKADAEASVNADVGSGKGAGSGVRARQARLNFRIGPSSNSAGDPSSRMDGRLDSGLEHGLSRNHGQEAMIPGRAAMLSARMNGRYGRLRAEQRGSGRVSRARPSEASYSQDFPDSTKGTAMLSPPDSNASPLEWAAGVDYGFPDFAERQFLEPTLHGGKFVGKKPRKTARGKAPATAVIPGSALTNPGLSTSLGDSLRVRVPDPLADLKSH